MQDLPIHRTRACAVCLKSDKLLMVNILDEAIGKHYWMPPGGQIEDDESPYLAAEREALEETGVIVKAYPEAEIVKVYEFTFKDQLYVTKTHFFLSEFFGTDNNFNARDREREIFTSEWVPLKTAFERMAPWPEIQSAVYDLVFPLLRQRAGDMQIDITVPFKKTIEED